MCTGTAFCIRWDVVFDRNSGFWSELPVVKLDPNDPGIFDVREPWELGFVSIDPVEESERSNPGFAPSRELVVLLLSNEPFVIRRED